MKKYMANQKKKVEQIINKNCKGCGICVEYCPMKVFEINDKFKAVIVNKDKCSGCRICYYRCPDFAIQFEK